METNSKLGKLFTASLATAAVSLLAQGQIANAILGFVFAGTIPGTSRTVPFWLMMAMYTAAISILVTWYIESVISSRRAHKAAPARKRMPQRRYSHI